MRSVLRRSLPLLSLFAVACVAPTVAESEQAETSPAPLVGVDGSRDSADTGCNVVLRSMSRTPNNTGGYVTKNNYNWIWTGIIDVSEAAAKENAVPAVLYQYGSDPTWRSVNAVKSADMTGFGRYTVDIWEGLPSSGMSGTSLSRAEIKVIPYLRMREGGRLFDHNRVRDPFGTYLMSGQSGLAVQEDASACKAPTPQPPPVSDGASIAFNKDGSVAASGPLFAPSKATLRYDIDRLTTCRGTHNGYPAWDIVAHVRFLPSRSEVSGSVRELLTDQGRPTNQAKSLPFSFDIPAGTVGIEVWFENYSGAGNNCQAWDSNNSRDYPFPIAQPVGWIGDAVVLMTRSATGRCDGAAPLNQGFDYSTWARQRAALRNVCFQVWKPGTTDRDNPNLDREVLVETHYRFAPTEKYLAAKVSFDGRVGNNARYAWDLGTVDPFAPYRCLTAPTTKSADGQYDVARMEFYFTANGVSLTQPGGAPFVGTFEDNAGAPHPCTP